MLYQWLKVCFINCLTLALFQWMSYAMLCSALSLVLARAPDVCRDCLQQPCDQRGWSWIGQRATSLKQRALPSLMREIGPLCWTGLALIETSENEWICVVWEFNQHRSLHRSLCTLLHQSQWGASSDTTQVPPSLSLARQIDGSVSEGLSDVWVDWIVDCVQGILMNSSSWGETIHISGAWSLYLCRMHM